MIFHPWNWYFENYSIVQSQTRNIKQLHYICYLLSLFKNSLGHIQYTCMVGKYINLHGFYKRVEKRAYYDLFLTVSQRVQINFILNDNVRILCLCYNVNAKLSEKRGNKRRSERFQMRHLWHQHLYWYVFFLLLNRNQVPEKIYWLPHLTIKRRYCLKSLIYH